MLLVSSVREVVVVVVVVVTGEGVEGEVEGEREREGEEEVEGGEVIFVPVTEARRDLRSIFSFFDSVRLFSRESMCILNSKFIDDSFAIF